MDPNSGNDAEPVAVSRDPGFLDDMVFPPLQPETNETSNDNKGNAFEEVAAQPETLHMAARAQGQDNREVVKMLLRNKADPWEKDKEGKTALEYAEWNVNNGYAISHQNNLDNVETLKAAMGLSGVAYSEEAPPPSNDPAPTATAEETTAPTTEQTSAAPTAGGGRGSQVKIDTTSSFIDEGEKEPAAYANSPAGQQSNGSIKTPTSTFKGSKNDHKDIQAKTAFSKSTIDGVLKRTTFIDKLSSYPSAPQVSIGSRGSNMFTRSASGPAPGTYNLPDDGKSKFKNPTCFSFGGGARWGAGQAPSNIQPGPGQYHPVDPSLNLDTKVGFGTSVRNKAPPLSQQNPGPGAYEVRSTVGGGLMFTACGRHPSTYMRSRSLPGPGAYTPVINGAYFSAPKVGFGTSTRGDFTSPATRGQPGPGTYEMQNVKKLGIDSPKYSATSRRRTNDLDSYVTPGPGTYNAHATSFGAPGAYSCRHVDEDYKKRDLAMKEIMKATA